VEKNSALGGDGEQERPDLVLHVRFRLYRLVHDPLGTGSLGAVFGFLFFGLLCLSIGVLITMRHVVTLHAEAGSYHLIEPAAPMPDSRCSSVIAQCWTELLAAMCFHPKRYNRENARTDDKSNRGSGDRSRGASCEDYEVQHFAERHGISADEARRLIKQHCNDRAKLDDAASRMKR
jgi:hypothetical protein